MEAANGAAAGQTQNGTPAENESFKLKFCTVCASNNNRYGKKITWEIPFQSANGQTVPWRPTFAYPK